MNVKLIATVGVIAVAGIGAAFVMLKGKDTDSVKVTTPAATAPAETPAEVTRPVTPEPRTAVNAYAQRVAEGEKMLVVFDACPFDDTGWTGKDDPLGILKCGETYEVQYNPADQKWTTYGLEEKATEKLGDRSFKTHTGNGSDPYLGRVSMWGLNVGVNELGEISLRSDIIGHLKSAE